MPVITFTSAPPDFDLRRGRHAPKFARKLVAKVGAPPSFTAYPPNTSPVDIVYGLSANMVSATLDGGTYDWRVENAPIDSFLFGEPPMGVLVNTGVSMDAIEPDVIGGYMIAAYQPGTSTRVARLAFSASLAGPGFPDPTQIFPPYDARGDVTADDGTTTLGNYRPIFVNVFGPPGSFVDNYVALGWDLVGYALSHGGGTPTFGGTDYAILALLPPSAFMRPATAIQIADLLSLVFGSMPFGSTLRTASGVWDAGGIVQQDAKASRPALLDAAPGHLFVADEGFASLARSAAWRRLLPNGLLRDEPPATSGWTVTSSVLGATQFDVSGGTLVVSPGQAGCCTIDTIPWAPGSGGQMTFYLKAMDPDLPDMESGICLVDDAGNIYALGLSPLLGGTTPGARQSVWTNTSTRTGVLDISPFPPAAWESIELTVTCFGSNVEFWLAIEGNGVGRQIGTFATLPGGRVPVAAGMFMYVDTVPGVDRSLLCRAVQVG